MAVSTQTVTSLNAFFKDIFAPEVENLIPEHEQLLKTIPYVSAEKRNGGAYLQPVILSRDHGISYHGQNDSQLRLNEPIGAIIDQASVTASSMTMRSFLSYTAAARAQKGDRAFIDATSYVVQSLTESMGSIIESTHWYGGVGLALVSTTGAGNLDLTNNWVVVDQAEWAAAVWIGGEGMPISFYNASGVLVLTTEVLSVDITNRKIYLASTSGLANANTYTIYRKGSKGMESIGLHSILTNTASMFGIDASQRRLWQANQYAAAGVLSFEKVAEAVAIAYGRGLQGKMTLYVNSRVFASLMPDFNTVKSTGSDFQSRIFTDADSVKSLSHGTKSLTFYVNSVELNVVATDYAKIGYAYGIADETFMRCGSTPMTFNIPGSEDGVYFRDVSEYAALELRAFVDEALFCQKPARNLIISGITP